MANRRASFRQVDLTRAVRAAKAAGLEVFRVEVEPCGKLIVVTNGSSCPDVALDRRFHRSSALPAEESPEAIMRAIDAA